MEETIKNDEKPWLFKDGNEGGPGRPPDTEEKKLVKKAVRELVKEYEESLADALPQISPILIAKAIQGDVSAIKELHDRVMGKPPQRTDITSGGEKIIPILGGISNVHKDSSA